MMKTLDYFLGFCSFIATRSEGFRMVLDIVRRHEIGDCNGKTIAERISRSPTMQQHRHKPSH
jgi:hypothetical protein